MIAKTLTSRIIPGTSASRQISEDRFPPARSADHATWDLLVSSTSLSAKLVSSRVTLGSRESSF
jgi:hypothetical protein